MPDQENPGAQPVPDPTRSYERAKPEAESAHGRLTQPPATPAEGADRAGDAAGNQQAPRQINAHDDQAGKSAHALSSAEPSAPGQPDHSMLDEEPDGWDLAPIDIHDKRYKRHPRKEGKGGTP
jgi:hypothetical protein